MDFAHGYGARVYAAVNTIVFDGELSEASRLVHSLASIGVDAVLAQDLAVAQMVKSEGIPLHASTQMDNRTKEKVRWLYDVGFQRTVLARELSLSDIREIHQEVPQMELEAFVHGALCVSFSGQCYASSCAFGRSANRGECAQMCRMKFSLEDAKGNAIVRDRHLLSLKDMCRLEDMEQMLLSGVRSFKIEGRLKNVSYVRNVVAAYSQRLNDIISKHQGQYQRASLGTSAPGFAPDLEKTFNRQFTSYLLSGKRDEEIHSFLTPKAMGQYAGKVKEIRRNSFTVSTTTAFNNGDGLCFINQKGEAEGFRVNRAEGNRIFPLTMPQGLTAGVRLWRNYNIAFERSLESAKSTRRIPIAISLSLEEGCLALKGTVLENNGLIAENENGTFSENGGSSSESQNPATERISTTVRAEYIKEPSQKDQRENMKRQLMKLGGSIFCAETVDLLNGVDQCFIPSSLLGALRRSLQEALLSAIARCLPERTAQRSLNPRPLTWHYDEPFLYNIANKEAALFYGKCGLTDFQPAYEVEKPEGAILMQCRHCLRFAFGFCQKNGGKSPAWQEPLTLRLGDGRGFAIRFDCKHCQMNIYDKPNAK